MPSVNQWKKMWVRFLKDFLARPTIFNTQKFIDVYEAQARDNVGRSIRKLGG